MYNKRHRQHSFILMILLLGCLLTLPSCGKFITQEAQDPWADIEGSASLTDAEKEFIQSIYNNRESWETLQDAESEASAGTSTEIIYVQWGYNGDILVFAPSYLRLTQGGGSMMPSIYIVDDLGNLTFSEDLLDPPIDGMSGLFRSQDGAVAEGVVSSNYIDYEKDMSEEEKLSALCQSYGQYKRLRQSAYGDVEPIREVDISRLSPEQKKLYDSLLATMDTWEIVNNRGSYLSCDSLGIRHFGDGTAEIHCYYPEVGGNGYSRGTAAGYALDGSSISRLSSDAESRLSRDLETEPSCGWSIYWVEAKKESVLFKYIVSNF